MTKKLFSLLIGIFLLVGLTQPAQAMDVVPERYQFDRFYYDSMDVKIDVTESGLYTIHTKIDAVFNRPQRGVEILLPQKYVMDLSDANTNITTTKRYYWKVENVENYSNYNMNVEMIENSAVRIRFGDQYTYLEGPHSYEYSYQIQTHDLNFNDLEIFLWDILGDGFSTSIDRFSFEVTLPKPVNDYPLYIYSGSYSRSNEYIDFEFENNQIIRGQSNQPLPAFTPVTAELQLPQGYFDFPFVADFSMIFLGLIGLGALLSIYWFFRYGKDEPMVETIEHQPPTGLSSAMVGYIYDNKADTEDVLSLIVEWASYGYLSIEEVSDSNMRLTKLRELPEETVAYEKRLFDNLFNNRTVVETKDLENKFYKNVRTAVLGLHKYFRSHDRRIFNPTSTRRQVLTFFLASLLFAMFIAYKMYRNTFFIELAFGGFGLSLGANIAYSVFQKLLFVDFTRQSNWKKIVDLILSIITTGAFFLAYYFILSYFDVFDNWFFVALIGFFVIIISAINMSRRTPYGNRKLGKILGLKRFIEEAEKDRLEMLVEENPQYFYSVLPYAYVLGISDIWSKKFEGIAIAPPAGMEHQPNFSPIWYTNRMSNMMHHTRSSMVSQPVQTSSSGGFGGGSFGGGGGGSFGGGGFGGGGGGAW